MRSHQDIRKHQAGQPFLPVIRVHGHLPDKKTVRFPGEKIGRYEPDNTLVMYRNDGGIAKVGRHEHIGIPRVKVQGRTPFDQGEDPFAVPKIGDTRFDR